MRENTCCFTGHRNLKNFNIENLKTNLLNTVEDLIASDIDTFICGGAMGFDILAALVVLQLKEIYPHIKLVLFLPYHNQDKYYDEKSKHHYAFIKEMADEKIYTAHEYYSGSLQHRNRCMVDNSAYLVSFCRKNFGGSYYTKEYAKSENLNIIEITDGTP